jgi:hypothetical protein
MRLARSGSATTIALLSDEGSAGEVARERLVDWRVLEDEVLDALASGSLATVSWRLMERACFSEISAFKRSPRSQACA